MNDPDPDMLDEYDFSQSRPNRHAARYAEGTNVVLLDPDVAAKFPNSERVNEALRGLLSSTADQTPVER